MKRPRPWLVVICTGFIILAAAKRSDSTEVTAPTIEEAPIIPPGLLIRNNSMDELSFYVAAKNTWSRRSLKSRDETFLNTPLLIVVPTSPVGEETRPPQKSPDAMSQLVQRTDDYSVDGRYFVRYLGEHQRWDLCWSINKKLWVVEFYDEGLC